MTRNVGMEYLRGRQETSTKATISTIRGMDSEKCIGATVAGSKDNGRREFSMGRVHREEM